MFRSSRSIPTAAKIVRNKLGNPAEEYPILALL